MKYFKNEQNGEVFGYDDDQVELIAVAVTNGLADITGSWPPLPTLEQIQAAQIALITTDYRAAIQADIDYMGATFNADYDTQNLMVSTLSAGQVPSEFFWQDITNSQIPLTYAQAQGLLLAISERRQLAFNKLQTLKSAIRAAVDVDAVALIAW